MITGIPRFFAVSERFPNAILLIGGKGPLRGELEERIADYGLSNKVRLLGFIPDHELVSYYQAADLFVVPSQALEGFGLITVEALASGLPVMATPVGGNKEGRFRVRLIANRLGAGTKRSTFAAPGIIIIL